MPLSSESDCQLSVNLISTDMHHIDCYYEWITIYCPPPSNRNTDSELFYSTVIGVMLEALVTFRSYCPSATIIQGVYTTITKEYFIVSDSPHLMWIFLGKGVTKNL